MSITTDEIASRISGSVDCQNCQGGKDQSEEEAAVGGGLGRWVVVRRGPENR